MEHDYVADGIAGLALAVALLTGWRRIADLFRPPTLRVVGPQRCYVQHWMGRPQIWLFLDLQNTGGWSTTVTLISIVLRQGAKVWRLSADSYRPDDVAARLGDLLGQGRELLVGSVTLKPDEHWHGLLDALDYPSDSDEKKLNELKVRMDSDYATKSKTAGLATPFATTRPAELALDPTMVLEAEDYFDRHFELAAGPYELFVAVTFEDGKRRSVSGYSFNLYDEHEKDLRAFAADYKYGITYSHWRGTLLPVRLRPIDDKIAGDVFNKLGGQGIADKRGWLQASA